jgi:ribonuclease HI
MAPNQQKGPLWGGVSVFSYNEDKGLGYRTSQISSIFTLEAMVTSESLTRINKIQGRNFSIFSDSRSMMTAISSSKNFRKRSPLMSHIKEQLGETKAARKQFKIHWFQPIERLLGTRKQ